MIKLSNDCKLEFLASSGALGYDGKGYWWEKPLKWIDLFDTALFTPITKTLTILPEKGYSLKNVRFIKDGVVNAIGLKNPGINWFIANHNNFNGIVSIFAEDTHDFRYMIRHLKEIENIKAVELNVSCANQGFRFYNDIIKFILKDNNVSNLPIILKLGINSDINNLIPMISDYIEAISINSVPWKTIFPDKKSPFEKFGGGAVSGKITQPYIFEFIKKLRKITDIPIIGSTIWEYEDINKLYGLGVSAISFGSLFLRYPWKPTKFVRNWNDKENEN